MIMILSLSPGIVTAARLECNSTSKTVCLVKLSKTNDVLFFDDCVVMICGIPAYICTIGNVSAPIIYVLVVQIEAR